MRFTPIAPATASPQVVASGIDGIRLDVEPVALQCALAELLQCFLEIHQICMVEDWSPRRRLSMRGEKPRSSGNGLDQAPSGEQVVVQVRARQKREQRPLIDVVAGKQEPAIAIQKDDGLGRIPGA